MIDILTRDRQLEKDVIEHSFLERRSRQRKPRKDQFHQLPSSLGDWLECEEKKKGLAHHTIVIGYDSLFMHWSRIRA